MRRPPLAFRWLAVLVLAGCAPDHGPGSSAAGSVSVMTVAERRRVLAWLECEECVDGELEQVKLLAQAKPVTVDTLGEDLLGGPSPARRSNVRHQFESSFQEDSAYAAESAFTLGFTRVEYVEHYLDNFISLYRSRAALALAAIGGAKAAAILDSASHGVVRTPGDTLRADVRLIVDGARHRPSAADSAHTIP